MNKEDFLRELRTALQGLPQEEIEARVSFYSEMIDDRIEEGLSEDEAVAQIGAVENIRAQIIAETPLGKLVREKVRPNRQLRIWEIVLLVLGAPVWIPLLISVAAILFSGSTTICSTSASSSPFGTAVSPSTAGSLPASRQRSCISWKRTSGAPCFTPVQRRYAQDLLFCCSLAVSGLQKQLRK